MPDIDRASLPVALVTGANKGIGWAVARALARGGHAVLLGARDPGRGEEAAERLRAEHLDVRFLLLSIDEDQSVAGAARTVADQHGRLDVLVNNAAIKLETAPSPPSTASLDAVRATFETNVFGTMRVVQAFLPLLRRSAAPRIVNVSSGLGSLTYATTDPRYQSKPLLSYNVAKTALNSLTVQFANELMGTPFKVNAADPGFTDTDMVADVSNRAHARPPELAAEVIVRLATLPHDGPTGGFFDADGEVPW